MIALGDIYRIKMNQNDGITPKGNASYRYKFIIVIGYDGKKYYGAVSTNTRDHHLIPIRFQYPVKIDGYSCFVNCYKLHHVLSERLSSDCFMGRISNYDYELIIGCVKESPRIPVNELRKFGIVE